MSEQEVTIPVQQPASSVKIEETAKGPRVTIHVYAEPGQPAHTILEDATTLYQDAVVMARQAHARAEQEAAETT